MLIILALLIVILVVSILNSYGFIHSELYLPSHDAILTVWFGSLAPFCEESSSEDNMYALHYAERSKLFFVILMMIFILVDVPNSSGLLRSVVYPPCRDIILIAVEVVYIVFFVIMMPFKCLYRFVKMIVYELYHAILVAIWDAPLNIWKILIHIPYNLYEGLKTFVNNSISTLIHRAIHVGLMLLFVDSVIQMNVLRNFEMIQQLLYGFQRSLALFVNKITSENDMHAPHDVESFLETETHALHYAERSKLFFVILMLVFILVDAPSNSGLLRSVLFPSCRGIILIAWEVVYILFVVHTMPFKILYKFMKMVAYEFHDLLIAISAIPLNIWNILTSIPDNLNAGLNTYFYDNSKSALIVHIGLVLLFLE
jgi:hypothetical protein